MRCVRLIGVLPSFDVVQFVTFFMLPSLFVVCFVLFCLRSGLSMIRQLMLLWRFDTEFVWFLVPVGRYPHEGGSGGCGMVGGGAGLDEFARRC